MLEYYAPLKHFHMTMALLSLALFVGRWVWLQFDATAVQRRRWLKILPHVVDTLLLVSAIGLAITLARMGVPLHWAGAKVVGLVVYIVLGVIAIKRGRTRGIRTAAFIAALLTFAYIVAVAFSKQAWPF